VQPWRPLPEDFAVLVLAALDPADAAEAAALITRAAALDDAQLMLFLTAFGERVQSSTEPVTAAELRAWLDSSPPAAGDPPPHT
jgi:hypothetical protein